MAFIETPRFPDIVAELLIGGEEFRTDVATTGLKERRNSLWPRPRRRWRPGQGLQTVAQARATAAFMRLTMGRANGFRLRAPFDYLATLADGVLGTGVSTGVAAYQLGIDYGYSLVVPVYKPVAGTVQVYVNGALVAAGGGAGQYTLNAATGRVTFNAPVPAAGATLRWLGEYDVPVRFDMDWLQIGHAGGLLDWQGASLLELPDSEVAP